MTRETAAGRLARMTRIEAALWSAGKRAAGIDEVGRGPLAGPVAAACVILTPSDLVLGVDDSKKLSEARREALFEQLTRRAQYARVGWVEPEVIDRVNILAATRMAMEQAGQGAVGAHFLVDAVTGLALPGEVQSLIHGDAISYLIAAASIVAKVARDRHMLALDAQYPQYGFARNKGYGTPEHIRALREYGPCPQHRRSFIKGILRDRWEIAE